MTTHNNRVTELKQDFFTQSWSIYRQTIDHNYLWHQQASKALIGRINRQFPESKPIRFLDLACGDAFTTASILKGRKLARYIGVDQSEVALGYARTYLEGMDGTVELVKADFLEYLDQSPDSFDVIYVGLSAHHFDVDRLKRLLKAAKKHLDSAGFFAAYEPVLLPDETHPEHFARFCAFVERDFHSMTPEEKVLTNNHVGKEDFPRLVSDWNSWANLAGFGQAEELYKSPDRLFEMMVFQNR